MGRRGKSVGRQNPLTNFALRCRHLNRIVAETLMSFAAGVPLLLVPALACGRAGGVLPCSTGGLDQRAADRRALSQRTELLNASALAPGSALACLSGGAGEAAETACEASVFASPQSTAAAVAYVGARLTLLADAQARVPALAAMFAASRRAIELDRFGIAAHVLARRDGCTAAQCAAFAWLGDTSVLKANMKAQVFDQYVSRHRRPGTRRRLTPDARSVASAAGARAGQGGVRRAAAPRRSRASRSPIRCRQIRFSVGGLDPAGQHHECRTGVAESGAAAAQAAATQRRRAKAAGGKSGAGAAKASTGRPPGKAASGHGAGTLVSRLRRKPRARHVHFRPHCQSRRNRLPHHPHGQAAGPAHHRGLFGGRRQRAACPARRRGACDRPGAGRAKLSRRSTS